MSLMATSSYNQSSTTQRAANQVSTQQLVLRWLDTESMCACFCVCLSVVTPVALTLPW